MKYTSPYRIVLAGVLTALGVLLPFVTAHAFGVPGTVLLPMHLPVLLMGLLCGPQFGAAGGLLIPVISSLLTGMPVAFPMLPIMMGELCTYGLLSGMLYSKLKWPIYPALLTAMAGGRVVYGLIFSVLLLANNGTLKALSVWGALVQGLPGIVVQLMCIPLLLTLIKRNLLHEAGDRAPSKPDEAFTQARQLIADGQASCVILRGGQTVTTAKGRGVAPLISLYEEQPEALRGAFVVDKVIGKAAAMILVLGGVERAYGELMSAAAREYLDSHGIPAEYGRCVDMISNRTGNGICPLEQSVMAVDNPAEGYTILNDTLDRLRRIG